MYVDKHISLKKEEAAFIEENFISLSRFVQAAIQEKMKQTGGSRNGS